MNTTCSARRFSVMFGSAVLVAGAIAFGVAGTAIAAIVPGTIIDGSAPFTTTFDEQGNGTITTPAGTIPNFHAGTAYGIQYLLNAFVQPGDVIITDPADISPTNPNGWSDILHFGNDDNLKGVMIYQSLWDENDTVHDLADIQVPFFGYYGTTSPFVIPENGPEGSNGFQWNAGNAIYNGISDTPEPSTLILAGLGLLTLFLFRWRRGSLKKA